MNIPESFSFDKDGEVVRYPAVRRYFLAAIILLVALLSFGVGRLTGEKREGVVIQYPTSSNDQGPRSNGQVANTNSSLGLKPSALPPLASSVYASSKGKRYYYQHCKSTIVEKNKVTFASASLAEGAGYTLAANCKVP